MDFLLISKKSIDTAGASPHATAHSTLLKETLHISGDHRKLKRIIIAITADVNAIKFRALHFGSIQL